MWTLGIDVAKYRHHATLLDEAGRTVFANLSVAQSRAGVDGLVARLASSGQAAGTAAALAAAAGVSTRKLDITALRDSLRRQGAELDVH